MKSLSTSRPMRLALQMVTSLGLALFVSATLSAGQIYGTIVSEGQALKETAIEIKCGAEAAVTGKTAADGAYRINVAQQGQCALTLPSYEGRPSITIFSTPNPTLYNLQLVKTDGKFEIRRRS